MILISSPAQFNSSEVSTSPGVYLFQDEKDEIIYIGKAKNLRQRVQSYFSDSDKPVKTQRLVSQIRSIDWIVVDNEVEALLLENKLVKQHMPKYNISLKDSKTYAYIAITREPYPRVLTSRRVSSKLESYGPYTDGFMRQDLTKLVLKIFKLRICRKLPKRACLNFHIGVCTAPCIGNVTKEEYQDQVEQARLFLKGRYEQTIQQLNTQMQTASNEEKYERALELRNQIASIQLLTRHQIVDNERRFDQDVIAFRTFGEKVSIVQMKVRKGVLLGKQEFTVDLQSNVEQEFLKALYTSNQIPREILVNKPCWLDYPEKAALEEFLSATRRSPVTITIPKRADKLSLLKLAEKNIEATIEEDSALLDLQTTLNLPTLPHIVECFDISNLGEEHIVSGMVRYQDGKPDKANYRRFNIKTITKQDDFASMNEVVKRRYKRLQEENTPMPDLIILDGGPGQINAAETALHSLGLQIPIISLAKKYEEIYLPDEETPRRFSKNNRMMLLLEQIRDATHNFSVNYNRKRRQMKMRNEFHE